MTADAPGQATAVYARKGGGVLTVNSNGMSVEGWLKTDVAKILRGRLYEFIEGQTEEAAEAVRSFVTPRHARGRRGYRPADPGPGFTKANIEGHYYDDTRPEGSLYGKVRLRQDLQRDPGSGAYPADRRAYIAAAVLNSGRYGGQKVTKVRVTSSGARKRQYWEKGKRRGASDTSKGQRPLNFWYKGYRAQRGRFEAEANRVLRGLED